MTEQISTIRVLLSRSGFDTNKFLIEQRKYNSVLIEGFEVKNVIQIRRVLKCLENSGYVSHYDWQLCRFVCSW